MPAVARALRTGGSNRSSPAPTTSNSSNNVQQEKEVEDVELESGEDGSPPAKKRKQKNPEKSHVEKMKQEASLSSTEEQTTDELEQDDLVDQMVADEQQMLNEEVVETVVQNEEDEEETTKSTGDDNDIENQEKKSIQIRIASNGQSEEGEDPSQGKFVVLEKENGQNANETLSDDEDVVKNQEVDHETTVEMEQIVEDDETVELTPYTEKSHNGHSGHILTTIPAGQHIQGYEMIDGDNTQQGDMVMVLQQQLIQMPRSEAYRLGYIHPNSIGNGHPGAQFMMPTIVAGQPAVMPVAQLGNLGQVAIMSPSQVVVQQSDLNTCDTIQEDSQQQQQGEQTRQEQPQVSSAHGQVVQQSDQPIQQTTVHQQEQTRELAPDELELEELTKKAVTSKTCQQLSVDEAQKLVDSQQCRPVTIRSNYDGNKKLKFECIFCPLMTHIYKKEIHRSFSYKESLRRHYEQHFNYALNQHRCTEKLPDGTPCPYTCKRSDHLDRHREKIHALSRADKGKQNRRAIGYHEGQENMQHAIQFSSENNIELNLREGGEIRLQAIQLEEANISPGEQVQTIPVVTTAQSINGQTIIQQLPEGTTVVNEKGETLVVQQVSQQVEVSQMEMEEVKPLKNEVVDD